MSDREALQEIEFSSETDPATIEAFGNAPDLSLADEEAPPLIPKDAPAAGRAGAVLQSAAFRLLIVVANAATGIFTARSLRPQGRGELAALLLLPQVLGGAVALGLPNALTFYVRKRPEEGDTFISAGLQLGVICSLLATLIGWVVAPQLLREYPPQTLWWARILLPTVGFSILGAFGRAVLEAKGRFFASNLNFVGFSAIALVGILALITTHRLETIPAGVVYAFSGLPGTIFLMVLARRHFRKIAIRYEYARELLSYGLRSYGGDLCGVLTLYIDQALVITLLSPAKMGAYVVALNLSRIVNVVQQSICVVLFPRSVGLPPEEVMKLNQRAMHASLIISLACGGVVALFGPLLLRLLYGREYLAASGVFRVLLLEVVINGVVAVAAQAFMALNRPGIVTVQQVSGLVLAVPLLLWLIPKYGLTGAGVAILLTTIARAIFIMASFPLVLKLSVPRIIPNREEWRWLGSRFVRTVQGKLGVSSAKV